MILEWVKKTVYSPEKQRTEYQLVLKLFPTDAGYAVDTVDRFDNLIDKLQKAKQDFISGRLTSSQTENLPE